MCSEQAIHPTKATVQQVLDADSGNEVVPAGALQPSASNACTRPRAPLAELCSPRAEPTPIVPGERTTSCCTTGGRIAAGTAVDRLGRA
ncbi:MAG: hypothetical protein ABW321_10030 [Polyangiales bacterium]